MSNYQVVQIPGRKDKSEINVVSDGKTLVKLSGPMSFFAAGAFILAQREKRDGCISVAIQAREE